MKQKDWGENTKNKTNKYIARMQKKKKKKNIKTFRIS